jgi:hypothetical protein
VAIDDASEPPAGWTPTRTRSPSVASAAIWAEAGILPIAWAPQPVVSVDTATAGAEDSGVEAQPATATKEVKATRDSVRERMPSTQCDAHATREIARLRAECRSAATHPARMWCDSLLP